MAYVIPHQIGGSKVLDPNTTVYTKDAAIIANLELNIQCLILTCKCELARHGHSYYGGVALIHTMQELTELHETIVLAGEHLSGEVRESLGLIVSGQIGDGEE